MNPVFVPLFLVAIPMGVFTLQLLKKPEGQPVWMENGKVKGVQNPRLVLSMAALLLSSIVGGFLAGSLKTGLVITLIILLAGILEMSAEHSYKKTRSNAITRELPLLLDFLVLQVESGHSILQAFKFASPLFPDNSPVNSGLQKFQENIRLGASVQTALDEMADFLETTGSGTALQTISQAIKHGTPLGEVLRNQSNRMRDQLVLEGEKFANTLSIKLLIPLLFFIFPASFLVIFSPVIVSLTKVFR